MSRIIPKQKVLEIINLPSDLNETPREIIQTDFKSLGFLPISGGWGYSKDDAVVINVNNRSAREDSQIDVYEIEKIFVEKRTYEELIIFRDEGEAFNDINWELLNQSLVHDDDKHYDVLKYKICGYLDDDWEFLKTEYEHNIGFLDNADGMNRHLEERFNRLICFETEFWFDITSFFGKSYENNVPIQTETDLRFIKKVPGDENSYEFFNLLRLHLIPELPKKFSESDTEVHKMVQISCFEENVEEKEGETFEILSVVVAEVSSDLEEPDVSQLNDDEYLVVVENLRVGTLKIWGPDDFEWLQHQKIRLKNGTNSLVTRFTYRDRVKRYNFALRFTHQNKKIVVMYQLNAEYFSRYAKRLQNLIENVDLI